MESANNGAERIKINSALGSVSKMFTNASWLKHVLCFYMQPLAVDCVRVTKRCKKNKRIQSRFLYTIVFLTLAKHSAPKRGYPVLHVRVCKAAGCVREHFVKLQAYPRPKEPLAEINMPVRWIMIRSHTISLIIQLVANWSKRLLLALRSDVWITKRAKVHDSIWARTSWITDMCLSPHTRAHCGVSKPSFLTSEYPYFTKPVALAAFPKASIIPFSFSHSFFISHTCFIWCKVTWGLEPLPA